VKYLVISDIAGQYDTLLALIKQVPEYDYILAVGDICDRGLQNKEVVDFFYICRDK
jgi:hypothetical protein